MHKARLHRIIPREANPYRADIARSISTPKPVCKAGQKFAIGGGQGNRLLKRKIAIIGNDGDISFIRDEPKRTSHFTNPFSSALAGPEALLDFGFTKQHVLACLWIIFLQLKLFRLCAWIFLCYIVKAGISCADKLNLQGCWLRHRKAPKQKRGLKISSVYA